MSKKHKQLKPYQPPRPKIANTSPSPAQTPVQTLALEPAAVSSPAHEPAPTPASLPETLTAKALEAIAAAVDAAQKLVEARAAENLSVSRAAGVKKELKELHKFLAAYAG